MAALAGIGDARHVGLTGVGADLKARLQSGLHLFRASEREGYESRSANQNFSEMLSSGWLSADPRGHRHSAYHWWPLWDRQVCWSHLIRDFTAIAERGGESKRIGDALLEESKQLFLWWNRVRDGTLSRESFRKYVSPLRSRVEALIAEGTTTQHAKTSGTCTKIQRVGCCLWYFVDQEGIEPTNNRAERAVRHGVLMRKVSLGTKSAGGSEFVGRILTAHATLRQQGRNVLAFVRSACEAQLHGTTPPSLLPPADAI